LPARPTRERTSLPSPLQRTHRSGGTGVIKSGTKPMPLQTGARLGPYEILSRIGAGGMGEVYRARDTRLGRDVAVKILPSSFSSDPDRLRRFEQEAKAAGLL